jgi:ribose transport system substrate-binding protein
VPAPAAKPTVSAAGAATKTDKAKGDIRVGFVVGSLDNPYWVTAKDAGEAEAKKQGIQFTVLGIPKETDIDKQVAIVEDLITQKVDALMLAPAGSKEIVPAVQQANTAGIPVICIDKCAEGGEIITLIATDNIKGAKLGAEYVAKSIGNKGKVAILEGVQASQPGRERLEGAKEGFGEFKDIEIVASQPGEWRQDKGQSATENILTAHPDLVGIFASNDQMALGALQAIAAAGKSDQVKIVGYDAIDPALQAVKDGKMSATVAQFPAKMAEVGV